MLKMFSVILSKPKSLVRILVLPWHGINSTRNPQRFTDDSLDWIRNLSVSDEGNVDHIPKVHNKVFIVTFGMCSIFQSYSVPIMNFFPLWIWLDKCIFAVSPHYWSHYPGVLVSGSSDGSVTSSGHRPARILSG